MVNDKRSEFLVKMKDGMKKIRFTSEYLCQAEKHLGGQSILAILSDETKVGFTTVRALLWAGMKGAGSPWSIEGVGKQMLLTELQNYFETIGEAFRSATGMTEIDEDSDADEDSGGDMDPTGIPVSATDA